MRNIIRIIVYVWLIGVWWRYWYQNPTRYQDLLTHSKTQIITSTNSWSDMQSGDISTISWSNNISGSQASGEQIIDLIAQQLSGMDTSTWESNPFGEIYITIPSQTNSWSSDLQINIPEDNNQINNIPDNSICTTPWWRSVAGADWTLAFESAQANSNNTCVIEKRICTQWVLGGSYTQHTCYFNQAWGQYEYLGFTWSDSTILIQQAELQLWITSNQENNNNQQTTSNSWDRRVLYIDDTQGVSNYDLIDRQYIPTGRTNNGWNVENSENSLNSEINTQTYELGPIIPRAPETKISASQAQRINRNLDGTQWIIPIQTKTPRLSYNTNTIKLDRTEPARGQYTCNAPRGTQTFHNQHVIAFESSSVPQGQLCRSELRTCTFGFLRWSYTREKCTIQWEENTDTNNPYTLSPWFDQWSNSYRYYPNGNYNNNRYNDRYYQNNNYSYTSPRKVFNQCIVDHYGFVGHGSTITMYDKAQVWPGQVCRSVVRLCDDGKLSGSDDYKYGTCTSVNTITNATPPSSTKINNTVSTTNYQNQYYRGCQDIRFGYLNHGASVKMYRQESVNYNQSCDYEYRLCNNGTLEWQYLYASCTIKGREYSSNSNVNVYNYNPNTNSSYRDYNYYYDDYYVRPYNYTSYNNDYTYYPHTQYNAQVTSYHRSQQASCSITDYGTLAHNSFLVMYRETSPIQWSKCDSIIRTCTNGSLWWSSAYTKLRCNKNTIP